ncbi:hypothetical protein FEM48_Zijuj04G0068200 [Ziziphus jujuba var. spinosa]|uniref:BED-type domain-containing protein n=1 Tax=Ziziphus jujuba var. spinosa TaxID=714518 RepID=A0A978VIE9_ZIZJJ|nr:hypothetical protein FEM48_Zijuj04G0068200 [Ziziphus jujuba var. spinosa]
MHTTPQPPQITPASPISNLHQPLKPPSSTSASSLCLISQPHLQINMDGLQINLESSSFEMPINLEDVASPMEGVTSGHKVKRKRKLTSKVWSYFDVLPLDVDGKQKCKCKDCGTIYLCDSKYGTGNLVRHLKNCVKRDTRDIG